MGIELKLNENKQVGYYLLSGERLYHDLMSEQVARAIIRDGTISISDKIPGFPLCVDGKYFIETVTNEDSL